MDSLNSLPVMDSLNISPQLIASLATIIQKQILTLQQRMSPQQQQQQQQMPPQQQQQQLPPQQQQPPAQQQHRQHQAPPQTQQTPVVKRSSSIVSNASILRSSSISRSGSLSSLSSGGSYDSSSCSTPPSSNKRPTNPPRLKRRKKRCHRVLFADREEESQAPEEPDAKQTTKSDRKVVIQEVLSFFDSPFLATRKSILFKRRLCKTHGKPTKPTLKQRPEMDPDLFRLLVVVPLRRLMGEAYATNYNLAQRYRAAAAKVVKKRRANHIQSWRPKNGMCARTLITRILSHTQLHTSARARARTFTHTNTYARPSARPCHHLDHRHNHPHDHAITSPISTTMPSARPSA